MKPTDSQLNVIYRWMSWVMPTAEARAAAKWAEDHKTKQEVSVEMNRLHELRQKHALTRESCLNSKFWSEFFDDQVGALCK